jgi:hypothetical protein
VTPPDLDHWLADPVIRTAHRRVAAAGPAELWAAAQDVRLSEVGALGRIIRWRIPGTPAEQTFRALFREPPFCVLAEGATWSVSGLAGRIWTLERDYPRLAGPSEFVAWDKPRTAKVVFAHWIEQTTDGSAIVSEARATGTDRLSTLRLQALWAVVGPFERLIGREALTLAARRAAS